MANILFIEDEINNMIGTVHSIESLGHKIQSCKTATDALKELRENKGNYDLIILDTLIPKGKATYKDDKIPDEVKDKTPEVGVYILEKIAEKQPNLPVIILTAFMTNLDDLKTPRQCKLFSKPVLMGDLLQKIEEMIKNKRDK